MQTKIDHQKSVADRVLSKLELLDRYCIVAGGAPRDWSLGNEATDIDVYLHYPIPTTAQQRISLLNHLGFLIESKHENWQLPEIYEANHHILHLYNCEFSGEKIQIIFVDQPTFTSVVDTFPISISKVWYKRGEIGVTEDFENSVRHKVLYKTVDSYKEDNKYLLKIKNKFSNYRYITKQELVLYEKQEQIKNLFEIMFKDKDPAEKKLIKDHWLSYLLAQ